MDALDAPQPLSLGLAPGTEPGRVGRPAMDAQKRALADDRYQKMVDLIEMIPDSAREFRFAIHRARRNLEAKASFRPLEKIQFSRFSTENFRDEGTLSAYLMDKYGPGRYFIEPLDEHNNRIAKMPAWVVTAGDEDDMEDDDFDDEPRGGGWRRRSRRRDDDYEDDERDQRANMADLLTTVGKQNAAQVATVAKGGNDLMSILMMTQQSNAEARAAEERRRDEMRQEERKREEDRAESRRREMEAERKDRDERDQRRRDDERREHETAEQRRRDENLALIQAANKRTEILVAAVTAAAPVLGKLFEKKEDTTLPLLFKSMEKKDDPMMLMIMKSFMDKANDDSSSKNMIQQFGEMSKITTQMTAESMRANMNLTSEINGTVMKKALDMMMASPQGQTAEGKSMIEQVMTALAGAADIVKTLVPAAAPAQQRVAHQAAPTAAIAAPAAPAPAPAAPAAAVPEKSAVQAEWDALTPEQQAERTAQAPRGAEAVIRCINLIQTNSYASQAEYQELIKYLVTEMPLDLRVAVLNGDEAQVVALMLPVVQANSQLAAWIMMPGMFEWIRTFVSQLPPSLEAVYGPAQAQRDQLAALLAAGPAPTAETVATPAEAATPAADATPAPTGEAAPVEQVPVVDLTGAGAQETAPAAEPAVEAAPAEAASHLDHPDAP